MSIVLYLTSKDPTLGGGAPRRIEVAERLTIGRGPDNDLTLDDPSRYLSKHHCVIDADAGGCTITDTSGNGVFLNDSTERLPRNAPVPLVEGNVLRLGAYEVTVATIGPPSGARSRADSNVASGIFGDPLAEPDDGGASHAALPRPAAGAACIDEVPSSSMIYRPLIPDDEDLLAGTPIADDWRGATQSDHAPSDQAFFAPPNPLTEKIPEDWEVAPAPPLAASGEVHKVDDQGPVRRDVTTSVLPSPGENEAIDRFLAAAGLPAAALGDADKVRLLELAGATLATSVRGLMEILSARAGTKREFRIERTMIGAAGNNPLKFSANAEEALAIMLLGKTPGFLAAKAAVEEAFEDVKNHHLAMLAGMQVALKTVIDRFDPSRLEQRLEHGSLIEGLLPAARKARNWDLFKALYQELATELEEDFQKAFGAEFARAYKERLDRS
jgi:type VI secretion system protein